MLKMYLGLYSLLFYRVALLKIAFKVFQEDGPLWGPNATQKAHASKVQVNEIFI